MSVKQLPHLGGNWSTLAIVRNLPASIDCLDSFLASARAKAVASIPELTRVEFAKRGVSHGQVVPETLRELTICIQAGRLLISDDDHGGCLWGESSNRSFRVWHDCQHYLTGADTSFPDEVQLGYAHVRELDQWFLNGNAKGVRMVARSLALDIMAAETYGQSYYYEQNGAFPVDQGAFVLDVLTKGLAAACEVTE